MVVPVSKRRKAKSSGKGSKRQQADPKQLLLEAQQAMAIDDFDSARELLQHAVALAPQDVEVLEQYGAILAEMGSSEEAVAVLRRAVALSPEEGHTKYLYLGQVLEDGAEAIAAVQKGVELLQTVVERPAKTFDPDEAQETREQYSAALCSLAEMRIASEEDVSHMDTTEIEALLSRAVEADAGSPEPLQVLASLRVEQGRPDEALAPLRQSMALWFRPPGAKDETESQLDGSAGDPDSGGDSDDDMSEAGGRELPSFEFRFETAKLLLELEETTEPAVQVLEGLVEENDSAPDVWYLLALGQYSGGSFAEAQQTVAEGLACTARLQLPRDDIMVTSLQELSGAIEDAISKSASS